MSKRLVICEINEEYLKKVKRQMKQQKLPMPKDQSHITVAHKPIFSIEISPDCECKTCQLIRNKIS